MVAITRAIHALYSDRHLSFPHPFFYCIVSRLSTALSTNPATCRYIFQPLLAGDSQASKLRLILDWID